MAKQARGRRRAKSSQHGALRRRVLLLGLLTVAALLVARAFHLEIVEHTKWSVRAENQHADTLAVPAARGTIYDRDGVPLASSREMWTFAVVPHEVSDTEAVIRALTEHLGFSRRQARATVSSRDGWVLLGGRYEESARAAIESLRGIHYERVMMRFYPHGDMAVELLGRVNASGEVRGGLESELDSVLAGRDGLAVVRVDSRGRPIPGAMLRVIEPVPGNDVTLTIDADLQEIAQEALSDALAETEAVSGEMLIADPRSGEILAAVSRRGGKPAPAWSAATSPYEPGSTIKPFTLASLLIESLATLEDSLYGEEGSYRLNGRTITDVHPHKWLTLREGFLQSSNVIMAKAATRMDPPTQYRRLRDFGFGTATGVGYPAESGGLLRRPVEWSRQSNASLAFGYEIAVTPIQLVMAYASIANGGVLMEPRIVREVRGRDGRVLWVREARAVRRVMPASVAEQLRNVMVDAVDLGTGRAASMGSFKVAGKTGTARLAINGRYVSGAYIATFAGFFPAEDPQLVFLVKLDRPRGDYYGGLTAAPVTKATLQAALAARGTPLDRRAVADAATDPAEATVPASAETGPRPMRVATLVRLDVEAGSPSPTAANPGAVSPAPPVDRGEASPTRASAVRATVPDVSGLSIRAAVRHLHAAGLRVRLEGEGRVRSTQPAAGEVVKSGAMVRVIAGGSR